MPRQGQGSVKIRSEELLLICYYDPNGISTVPETVAYMQAFSRFPITILNMAEHSYDGQCIRLAPNVDLSKFSGIVFHNTITYNPENLRSLDMLTSHKFRDFTGVKVLMKQDDNHKFRATASFVGDAEVDLVFTCLPDDAVRRIYPEAETGNTRFERMLTGYVTPTLRTLDLSASSRSIDIGYRGSIQPLWFGRLAYEKRKIGTDVGRRLAGSGLRLDISSRWEDRFGGDAWFSFLSSCRATLGTESGASIFDLDDDLNERAARIEADIGPARDDDDYADAYLTRLQDLEDRIDYRQISPRHFEAAACGTMQILYAGRYSDILKPGRHFFPLAADYHNIDEAVDLLRDERRRARMVSAAYEEVIQDRRWWIETFIERFDDLVEELGSAKAALGGPKIIVPDSAHHVLLLAAQEPRHDPRHGWTERWAPADVVVHQIGIMHPAFKEPIVTRSSRNGLYWAIPLKTWEAGSAFAWVRRLEADPAAVAVLHELAFLESVVSLSDEDFLTHFAAPPNSPRLHVWRWSMQLILNTTITLIEAASAIRGIDAIIASDLSTLPAAIILKALFGIQILYDAHEYMPDAEPLSQEFEKQFWSAIERRLVPSTAFRQTVTPGLAALMEAEYGLPYDVVVNAEPCIEAAAPPRRPPTNPGQCVFLFCGLFGVGRGLDVLIDAWPETSSRAILHLQGPDNDLKRSLVDRAAATGLLGTRILFPEPVSEDEIVETMALADVGLIPYEPISINHRFCCPNKLSQYMAAGLPILANATHFVGATVSAAGCGRVVNFRNRPGLVDAVRELAEDQELRHDLGRKAASHFRNHHNWQKSSEIFYERIRTMLEGRERHALVCHAIPQAAPVEPTTLDEETDPIEPMTEATDRRSLSRFGRLWQHAPRMLRRARAHKTVE